MYTTIWIAGYALVWWWMAKDLMKLFASLSFLKALEFQFNQVQPGTALHDIVRQTVNNLSAVQETIDGLRANLTNTVLPITVVAFITWTSFGIFELLSISYGVGLPAVASLFGVLSYWYARREDQAKGRGQTIIWSLQLAKSLVIDDSRTAQQRINEANVLTGDTYNHAVNQIDTVVTTETDPEVIEAAKAKLAVVGMFKELVLQSERQLRAHIENNDDTIKQIDEQIHILKRTFKNL
jgi:hypothetical protein